jgi:hypothetical protein
MRQPWALKVRRMIELDDSLKMEKISKEREGAWDWGDQLQKSAVPLVDFRRGLERYFSAHYTLYQGLCRPY